MSYTNILSESLGSAPQGTLATTAVLTGADAAEETDPAVSLTIPVTWQTGNAFPSNC